MYVLKIDVNVVVKLFLKVADTTYLVKTINDKPDGCIVWNAHNTVLGEEALVIYVIQVCYVKTGRYGKT